MSQKQHDTIAKTKNDAAKDQKVAEPTEEMLEPNALPILPWMTFGDPRVAMPSRSLAGEHRMPLGVAQRITDPRAFTTANILALQRTIGNRAVTRLIQTKRAAEEARRKRDDDQ